jgi:hypothetical protein
MRLLFSIRSEAMRVTFILRNLSDAFYNGNSGSITGLLNLSDSDKFWELRNQASGDLRHCVKMKVGTSQFRDSVDLNAIVKRDHSVSFKIEPRKGYKLVTFIFS